VQQIALVRVIQRIGDCGDDLGDLTWRQAGPVLLGEQAAGVGALDLVHRNPDLPVVFATVVHTHDVRMPEGGGDVGLSVEPLTVIRVSGHRCRQHLQRVLAGESRMLGQVDLSRTTRTQE